MKLKELSLSNFRNLNEQKVQFDKGLNILYGENGQGKTSILEAIYFLAISKSYRAKSEKIVLQFDKEFFDIKGIFANVENVDTSIRIFYSQKDGKNVFVNDNRLEKFSEIIGITPVILLSLEDMELTYGVPSNRRRFIDILLSQINPIYLNALQNYKKSLLQRNKHLSLIYEKRENVNSLFPWDEQLIHYGSEIIKYRISLIEYLNDKISYYYRSLSDNNENISLEYKSKITINNKIKNQNEIKNRFSDLLKAEINIDLQKQSSTIGPHRDDIQFYLDNKLIKSFGSQGENKTFLIALKFLEGCYIKKETKKKPIFLMDDIFGELDGYRIERLAKQISTFGQTFITTTDKKKFTNTVYNDINYIKVKNGNITQ